jgi:pimeloyl-ACP methyl ester carboxylesterase
MTITLNYDHTPPNHTLSSTPYLVFIHGAGGDKTQWKYQIPFFKQLGWGILALCLPGRGGSPNIESTSISDYAKVVANLISSLKLTNITLVGHSMGGAVSMQIVVDDDLTSINRIVLISSGAKLRVAPLFFDLIAEDFGKYRRMSVGYMFTQDTSIEIKEEYKREMQRNGKEILTKDLRACNRFNIISRVKDIQVPSLVICGEDDRMTPVKYSTYLRDNLGGESRLEIISKRGHFVHQSAADTINQLILEFHQK